MLDYVLSAICGRVAILSGYICSLRMLCIVESIAWICPPLFQMRVHDISSMQCPFHRSEVSAHLYHYEL